MRRVWLLVGILLAATVLSACEEQASETPKPDEVPMSKAPAAPNPGNYTGLQTRSNPRPPRSGLNADPANPSGAPGGSAGPGIAR